MSIFMKLTNIGFLICFICMYLLVVYEGSSLYAVGGWVFIIGVIVAVIGLFEKWN